MDPAPLSLDSLLRPTQDTTQPLQVPQLAEPLSEILAEELSRFSTLKELQSEIGDFLAQNGVSLAPEERQRISQGLAFGALASVGSPLQPILEGKCLLKKGARPSPQVGILQDLLREQGFPINDRGGRQRGYFGPQTETALRAFQEREGLKVDGVLGPKTLGALLGLKDPPAASPAAAAPAAESLPSTGLDVDAAGLELIAGFEQFEPRIYPDPTRHPTIGYGHLLRPGEEARFAGGITREEGQELLRTDAAEAVQAVNELVTVELNQNQFNALVSFTFNVGRGSLAQSTLLRELNNGNYAGVAGQLNRWVYSDGVYLRGLERRRAAEGNLFNTPPP